MNSLRRTLVAAVVGLVMPAPVLAQDGDGAVHLNLLITSAEGDACGPEYAWIDGASCADLTSVAVSGPARVWVIVSRVGGFPDGVAGVEFGVEYTANVIDWTTCTDGPGYLVIPGPGWPDSGSSVAIAWPGGCYRPPGENARVGCFTVADGASGFIRIVTNFLSQPARYVDCEMRELTICEASLAAADLSQGTTPLCDVMPLNPATDCTATDGPCPVMISWAHDGVNAAGFRILRDEVPLALTGPGEREYEDASAVPGVAHSYAVVAFSACGVAEASPADDGTAAVLAAPSDCAATRDQCGFVRVSWTDQSDGEAGFHVVCDGGWIADVGAGETHYDHTLAVPGRRHWYSVIAFNSCGESEPSNTYAGWIPPLAPTGCNATEDLCGYVGVSWTDESDDELTFTVLRDDEPLAQVGFDVTHYDDHTAVPGQSHAYAVVASGPCGSSVQSNGDTGNARGLVPASSCSASDDDCDLVHVSWTDESPDEDGFDIVRDAEVVATVGPGVEEYDDATVAPGESHTYVVVAFNDCLRAEPSNEAAGTRASAPQAPSTCEATDDLCGLVRVSWTPGEGEATGFTVFRDGEAIVTVGADATHYADTGVTQGETPSYAVLAFNECGDGGLSTSDVGGLGNSPPQPATGCVATDDLCGVVQVSWIDESLDESGFRILRDDVEIAIAPPDETRYDDVATVPGETYSYTVVTTSACGDAAASNANPGGSVGLAPPAPPDLLAPEDGATCLPNPVELRWSREPAAVLYRVRVGSGYGMDNLLDATTPDTTVDVTVPAGETAFWYVVGKNSCDAWGAPSACFQFEMGGVPAPEPLEWDPYSPSDAVHFWWPPVEGAEHYLLSINQRDYCHEEYLTVTHTVAAPETTLDLTYCVGPMWGLEFTAWVSGVSCGIAGPPSECLVFCCNVPVLLEYLDAAPRGQSIEVRWQTSVEEDVAGFHLYRREESGGAFLRITSDLIAAGARRYAYEDRDVIGGRAYRYRLVEITSDGSEVVLGETSATAGTIAPGVTLHAGHPNPFNPTTTLEIELPVSCRAVLDVFDSSGRWVRRLAEGVYGPGLHRILWDGRDGRGVPAPSGTYFVRLSAGGEVREGRLVLVR